MESHTPNHLPPKYLLTFWSFSFLMGRLIRLGRCLSLVLTAIEVMYREAGESGLEKSL
ncbi:hypothetical protein D8674_004712 [Pyrus ussuriensis x Pyrus communis]|uniref:Uncharacterized protein n=1 Tax=Pyrus ussuriensis x Pyrus communis TaxID=2448454 RepID=A0A5N5FLG8_9ROSA|nr:hypothetical protein D8674_004712 [Pyrus ussuriensis x Pyrus communis]